MKRFSDDVRWVTEKELAIITGLSLGTLRAHRFKRIGIRYYKIGKSVRYRINDIESYMNAHLVEMKV